MGLLRKPSLNTWRHRGIIPQRAPSTLRLGFSGEFLERVHRNTILQGGLVRRVKVDSRTVDKQSNRCSRDLRFKEIGNLLRHHWVIRPLRSLHGFFPPRCAETPFAAWLQPDASKVIASRRAEVKELLCQLSYPRFNIDASYFSRCMLAYRLPRGCLHLQAQHGSNHPGRSPSLAIGRKGREAF